MFFGQNALLAQLMQNSQQAAAGSLGQISNQSNPYNGNGGLAGLGSLPVPKLRRYDPITDEMVTVTQEWVDEAMRAMNKLAQERDQLKRDLSVAIGANTNANRIIQELLAGKSIDDAMGAEPSVNVDRLFAVSLPKF